MKPNRFLLLSFLALAVARFTGPDAVASLTPEAQTHVDARIATVKAIAADSLIVEAVAAQNAGLSAEQAAVKQELWSRYNNQQKLVHALSTNKVAGLLQSKCENWATEAFLSDSHGFKVAFLSKPTNWCHAGKPKHDEPMAGRAWQGPIEIDASTGLHQLQVSVPVLKDGVPIGSLVVGLNLEGL